LKLDKINDELLGTIYEHKRKKRKERESNMFVSLKNNCQTSIITIIISWLGITFTFMVSKLD
jgi:hypothetical protein